MCLGIPGKIIEVGDESTGLLMGKVSFGGLAKEICLAYTPDVEVGDYVLIHVGFAISKIDEDHANELFAYLAEMDQLAEMSEMDPAAESPVGTTGPDKVKA